MILSIGIDTVTISNVERFLSNPHYADDIFTEREQKMAKESADCVDTYARSFAAKQAVKKILAEYMDVKELDYTSIEVLTKGSFTFIKPDETIQAILDKEGIKSLMVSITSEGDQATAFVMAQK